jgi:hypothetical protein
MEKRGYTAEEIEVFWRPLDAEARKSLPVPTPEALQELIREPSNVALVGHAG